MKPPKKKPIVKKCVRRAAQIGLLKHVFAELYTPTQLTQIKFDARVDYGMDREIIDFFIKTHNKFGRLVGREPFEFEIFKLILLYILTPDIRGIVGNIEILDFDKHHRLELSKVEKIRREIYDYKHRPRHPAEPHVANLLDFIFKKIEPTYKYTEIVYFSIDSCNLDSILDVLCDAAPKKEQFSERPEPLDHIVFFKKLAWPDRGYVISPDIYKTFPELEAFFDSREGMEFYKNYMMYIANKWPSMQHSILDYVNAFTNQYFKWIVEMISFPANLPPEMRWKYEPLGTPCKVGEVPQSTTKILLRVIEYFSNGKSKKKYVFIHDIRVIFMKLKMLGVPFLPGGEPLMPEEKAPLVHEIVEFTNQLGIIKFLQVLVPNIYDYVDTVETPLHSLSLINDYCLPIVSSYNTHCIPDVQGMERIAQILIDEAQIGRRIPLNFRCLEVLIKKMDTLFTGHEPYKTLVDRQTVQGMIAEATELMDKYNGKLTAPSYNFANLNQFSTWEQKMDAFLNEYPQYKELSPKWRAIECPIPPDYKRKTPPGAVPVSQILDLIWKRDKKL